MELTENTRVKSPRGEKTIKFLYKETPTSLPETYQIISSKCLSSSIEYISFLAERKYNLKETSQPGAFGRKLL